MRTVSRRLLPLAATSLLSACISFGPMTPGSPATSPTTAKAMQSALDKATAPGGVPGALALVDSPGKGTWTGASGWADIAARTPMRPTIQFRIGSVTKTFLAVSLMKAVEAGKLRLDDAVGPLLPSSIAAQVPNASMITVRQLLDHSSGLPDYVADERFQADLTRDLIRAWTPAELIAVSARKAPAFAPGAGVEYSNTGYTLAGMVLETATGKPYTQAIQDDVLSPLGLQDTIFPTTAEPADPTVRGYGLATADGTRPDYSRVHPSFAGAAGDMISTARDLDTFAQALRQGRLVTAESLLAMQTAGTAPKAGGPRYGLGLERFDTPAGPIYGKTGGIYGGGAFVGWFTDGTVVVTAVNEGPGGGNGKLNSALMQALLMP